MKLAIDKRMIKARAGLITLQPFFGTLALHLELVEEPACQTMATDGKRLLYAPAFLDQINEPETLGVVAHEVMHCAFRHHTRRNGRDPELWNEAGDYVINRDLIKAGFCLPKSALLDSQYDGLSTEEVYAILARKNPPQSKGKRGSGQGAAEPGADGQNASVGGQAFPKDKGGCGTVIDAVPEGSEGELGEEDAKWETQVRQALNVAAANNAGSVPGALARLALNTKEPREDWRSVLRRFVDDRFRMDYAWTRPNKRLMTMGICVPGLIPDGINHIGIVVDTSGSIDQHALEQFSAEIQAAVDEGAVARITVAYCDTQVNKTEEYQSGDRIQIKAHGGGGTRFSPAITWFNENEPDVSAIIYFTDLCCSDFGQEPIMPVLWAAYGDPRFLNDAKVPYGEIVKLVD